jgi:hypothetical protein
MAHALLTVLLIISILILFVSMILSAKSASDINKGMNTQAHKMATWSAVVSGLAVLLLVVALIYYLYSNKSNMRGALGMH